MRYGMNPHQPASIVAGHGPRVINGEPSMINYLDALNAFELVREADEATGVLAAASFKHVSPAGAALAGPVDATAARTGGWTRPPTAAAADGSRCRPTSGPATPTRSRPSATSSRCRGRSTWPPPSSCARSSATRLIAPGFEPGTAAVLAAKRDGRFLVLEADPGRTPPATERRDVLGVTIEQDRDRVPVATVLPDDGRSTPPPAPTRCSGW